MEDVHVVHVDAVSDKVYTHKLVLNFLYAGNVILPIEIFYDKLL